MADGVALDEPTLRTIADSYHQVLHVSAGWERTFWRGHVVQKLPSDLFVYQEMIYTLRPDYIVETGTHSGGAALFFADMMELNGHGQVITVDNFFRPNRPGHHRIRYITDNSLNAFKQIEAEVKGKRAIVSLDSDHKKAHVLQEMELYAPLATEYLVVEDTNVNHPVFLSGFEDGGPWEAVEEFLGSHPEFKIDTTRHKFIVTFNPNGWLRRVDA